MAEARQTRDEIQENPEFQGVMGDDDLDGLMSLSGEVGKDGEWKAVSMSKFSENFKEQIKWHEPEIEQKKQELEQRRREREKQERLNGLAGALERSTQKSFAGKLKSFFVGNSKEYETALKAVKGLADGTADKQQAAIDIMGYLDMRKDKVRDHEYGRDRFDAMMKSLATVMEPEAFEAYCDSVDQARKQRDPNYKGKTDANAYLTDEDKQLLAERKAAEAERKAAEAERKEAEARLEEDIERIRSDGAEPGYAERHQKFLDKLRSAKDLSYAQAERFRDYTERHPAVREEARKIVEQKGLDVEVPTTAVDKMEKADQENLRGQARDVQKLDRQKHAQAKEQPQAQSKGPEV